MKDQVRLARFMLGLFGGSTKDLSDAERLERAFRLSMDRARTDQYEYAYDGREVKDVYARPDAKLLDDSDSEDDNKKFVIRRVGKKFTLEEKDDSSDEEDQATLAAKYGASKLKQNYFHPDLIRQRREEYSRATGLQGMQYYVPRSEELLKETTGRYSKSFRNMLKDAQTRVLPLMVRSDILNAYKMPHFSGEQTARAGVPLPCALAMGEVPVGPKGEMYIRSDAVGKKLGTRYGGAACFVPEGAMLTDEMTDDLEESAAQLYLLTQQLEIAKQQQKQGKGVDFQTIMKAFTDSLNQEKIAAVKEKVTTTRVKSKKAIEDKYKPLYEYMTRELAQIIMKTPRFRSALMKAKDDQDTIKMIQQQVAGYSTSYVNSARFCVQRNLMTARKDRTSRIKMDGDASVGCKLVQNPLNPEQKYYVPDTEMLKTLSSAGDTDRMHALEFINEFQDARTESYTRHPLYKWFMTLKKIARSHQQALNSTNSAKLFDAEESDDVPTPELDRVLEALKKMTVGVRDKEKSAEDLIGELRRLRKNAVTSTLAGLDEE